jgi:hypothetical protein
MPIVSPDIAARDDLGWGTGGVDRWITTGIKLKVEKGTMKGG